MPSPDVIRERINGLNNCNLLVETPSSEKGEIWRDQEYGVEFEVVKVSLRCFEEEQDKAMLALTIRGRKRGRERLATDFSVTLGEPDTKYILRGGSVIFWN